MKAQSLEKRVDGVETRLSHVEGDVNILKMDVTLLNRFKKRAEKRFQEFTRFKNHVYGMMDEISTSLDQMQWHAVRLRQGVDRYQALHTAK